MVKILNNNSFNIKKLQRRVVITTEINKNIPDYEKITERTYTRFHEYAHRCKALFKIVKDKKDITSFFTKYGKVLFLENDVLIASKTAPDIFEKYQTDKLCVFNENIFFNITKKNRYFLNYFIQYKQLNKKISTKKISNNYFNSHIFLCNEDSNPYKYWDLLNFEYKPYNDNDVYFDSHFFNLAIGLKNIPIIEIDRKFNRMIYDVELNMRTATVPFVDIDGYFYNFEDFYKKANKLVAVEHLLLKDK